MSAPTPSSTRLIPVGVLAALLPLISWVNIRIVAGMNGVLHRVASDEAGWMIYTACRSVLFGCLVVAILRLRSTGQSQTEAASPARGLQSARHTPMFDPLIGLRALAAFMVFLGHYFIVLLPYREPQPGLTHHLFTFVRSSPWAGVWTFFTLSGFLMAKGFASGRYAFTPQSIYDFYRNRFLRIVPLYVGAFLFISLLVEPVIFHPSNWWQIIEVLIFDYRSDLPKNPMSALWSVSTEVQFYLLVPFLFLGIQFARKRAAQLLPFLVPIALCLGYVFRRHLALVHPAEYNTYGYTPLLPNLDIFFAGMCLSLFAAPANLTEKQRQLARFALPAIAALLFVVSAKITGIVNSHGLNYIWRILPPITYLFAATFILCAQIAGRVHFGTGLRRLTLRWIARAGTLTYGLYVLHSQILLQFRLTLRPTFPALLSQRESFKYFPLLLLLVWLAAEAAYRFVEEPFEQRKHVPGSALLDAP